MKSGNRFEEIDLIRPPSIPPTALGRQVKLLFSPISLLPD
jgi:hypothetical protein